MNTFDDYKKARLGTKYTKRVTVPNSEVDVGLKVLTANELLEAESAKNEYLKSKKLEEVMNATVLENNCQVLYRSCVNPDSNEKFFRSVAETRDLTSEDVAWLAEQYNILSDSVNPASTFLTEKDVAEVKKKLANGEPPINLGYSQLLQLVMVLGASTLTGNSEVKSSSEAS
jgi:hypothetical protein